MHLLLHYHILDYRLDPTVRSLSVLPVCPCVLHRFLGCLTLNSEFNLVAKWEWLQAPSEKLVLKINGWMID